MASKPLAGEIATRPLPAVLLDLHEAYAHGRLTLRRGKIIKTIELSNGNPMSATSTPRDETLGHFLVAEKVITDAHHQDAMTRAALSGARLGETLVAMGVISLETLFEQLRRQARYKLVSALRWPQGSWRFEPGTEVSHGMAMRMLDVIVLGLKETAHEDVERLTQLEGRGFQLTPRGERLEPELRKYFGDAIACALAEASSVQAVEQRAADRLQARIAIDALLMCDAAKLLPQATTRVGMPRGPALNQPLGAVALIDDDAPIPEVLPPPSSANYGDAGPARTRRPPPGRTTPPRGMTAVEPPRPARLVQSSVTAPPAAEPLQLPRTITPMHAGLTPKPPAAMAFAPKTTPLTARGPGLPSTQPSPATPASGGAGRRGGIVEIQREGKAPRHDARRDEPTPATVIPRIIRPRHEAAAVAPSSGPGPAVHVPAPLATSATPSVTNATPSVTNATLLGAVPRTPPAAKRPLAYVPELAAPTTPGLGVMRAAPRAESAEDEATLPSPHPPATARGSQAQDLRPATLRGPELAARLSKPPARRNDDELFDQLFSELQHPLSEAHTPIFVEDEDSGVVSTDELAAASATSHKATVLRQKIAAEAARIRGLDHYGVLMVARDASSPEISAAVIERQTTFARDYVNRFDLGLDRHKLDELHRAYNAACECLLDDVERANYDARLAGTERPSAGPNYQVDLAFRDAEALMSKGAWAEALPKLAPIVAQLPDEADYHAAYGWAMWHAHGQTAEAADAARLELNHALAADPDHATAHAYKGRIDAAMGTDDEGALFHLEKALALEPTLLEGLDDIERLLARRGDYRRYEAILKRLLFRLNHQSALALVTWLRLATLYATQLDDLASAHAALESARAIAPDAHEVVQLETQLAAHEASLPPPRALEPAKALPRRAEDPPAAELSFLRAAEAVALGHADTATVALYERHRHAKPVLPTELPAGFAEAIRHPDDDPEIEPLMTTLAPVVFALAPLTLEELELSFEHRLTEEQLPLAFRRVLGRLAELFGVPVPAIYSRPELGAEVHVIATLPPALMAGDDALTAPERAELVFRLARALWLISEARAMGGTRPGRVLRAAVLAAMHEVAPPTTDELMTKAFAQLGKLPMQARLEARARAGHLKHRGAALNLNAWSRGLVRTADRVALALCGDPAAALTCVRSHGELQPDLREFVTSANHIRLRAQLGLRA